MVVVVETEEVLHTYRVPHDIDDLDHRWWCAGKTCLSARMQCSGAGSICGANTRCSVMEGCEETVSGPMVARVKPRLLSVLWIRTLL